MAHKVKNGYECGYCRKFYTNPIDADNCKESHNLVYVALTREELQRLIMFIYTGQAGLVTPELVQHLQTYHKANFILDKPDK